MPASVRPGPSFCQICDEDLTLLFLIKQIGFHEFARICCLVGHDAMCSADDLARCYRPVRRS